MSSHRCGLHVYDYMFTCDVNTFWAFVYHKFSNPGLSLLRSAELEGMVRQRLITRLADGCARMPAALKDILSCGDPVRARVIAPPQGSCHRACSTRACECVALTAEERGARRYGEAETDTFRD